jgi:Flp pilus assembly protein TadG
MTRKIWQRLRSVTRLGRETSGAEIAEAAVVLPLLCMLLFGIMWFARAFNIYATVNRAAREGALAAARPTSATAALANTFPTQTDVINVVNPILAASHLDPSQAVITLQPDVPLYPGSLLVDRVVEVDYPYNFRLNGLTCCPPTLSPITTGIVIKGRAQAQRED